MLVVTYFDIIAILCCILPMYQFGLTLLSLWIWLECEYGSVYVVGGSKWEAAASRQRRIWLSAGIADEALEGSPCQLSIQRALRLAWPRLGRNSVFFCQYIYLAHPLKVPFYLLENCICVRMCSGCCDVNMWISYCCQFCIQYSIF